jgi:hypothetical protein
MSINENASLDPSQIEDMRKEPAPLAGSPQDAREDEDEQDGREEAKDREKPA